MKNEDLYSISKENLIVGIKETYKNAYELYTSGIRLSFEQRYGVANSLLILSVEECIKCLVLVAIFCNVQLPPEIDINRLLASHKNKHREGKKMQSYIKAIYRIKDAISIFLNNEKSPFHKLVGVALVSVLATIESKFGSENQNSWWDDADNLKQKGFYVDFCNHKWNLPSAIDQTTYRETLNIVKPFVESLSNVNHIEIIDWKTVDLEGFLNEHND
jgi:AbiV family abortive infection protein